jgi:hypothetical protein
MEIRYAGLAPTPETLKKILSVGEESGDSREGEAPQYEIRQEDYPAGASMGFAPTLGAEVAQIIYSTHWEYQKRILDHVEAVISSDRQWTIIRKILMGVMTEQVDRTRMLVGQKIRQAPQETNENEEQE